MTSFTCTMEINCTFRTRIPHLIPRTDIWGNAVTAVNSGGPLDYIGLGKHRFYVSVLDEQELLRSLARTNAYAPLLLTPVLRRWGHGRHYEEWGRLAVVELYHDEPNLQIIYHFRPNRLQPDMDYFLKWMSEHYPFGEEKDA